MVVDSLEVSDNVQHFPKLTVGGHLSSCDGRYHVL